jgi:uncharacterized membrane protein YcaP (DUF421 family)
LETVLRAATIYLILLAVMRLSGRRTLVRATPFDFVLLLIVAETTQQAMVGDDGSITNALILIVTLFGMDVALSYAKRASARVKLWLDGTPTVLISQNHLDVDALNRSRVDVEDILSAGRIQCGVNRLDQIENAVLEVGGAISVTRRDGTSPGNGGAAGPAPD